MSARRIRVLLAKPGLDGHDVGAKVVVQALLDAGFEVTYTGLRQTPEAIAKAAKAADADVVGLSILSGAHLPLCRRVREVSARTGIILLTARDAIDDRVRGLDSGADDYLTKPFDLSILIARIQGLLRRREWLLRAQPEITAISEAPAEGETAVKVSDLEREMARLLGEISTSRSS